MYGDQYILAACFYFVGVVYATARIVAWEERRNQPKGTRIGVSVIVLLLSVGVLAASLKWIQSRGLKRPVAPVLINIEVAPLVMIKPRQYEVNGQMFRGTDYGFAAILRVLNQGPSRQFIQKLEVSGDIAADYMDYEDVFGNTGHVIGYLAKEYQASRPFLRLLRTAYPTNSGAIDPGGDQQFIRFVFLEPSRLMRTRMLDQKFYFGLHASGISPHFVTTTPYLFDLVQPTRASADHIQMGGFVLRDEARSGAVRFIATFASSRIAIPPKQMRPASDVIYRLWDNATNQDLFYGTEDKTWPLPVPDSKHGH